MSDVAVAIIIGAMAVLFVVVVAASLTRCRHCGRWHDSELEEQQCRELHWDGGAP